MDPKELKTLTDKIEYLFLKTIAQVLKDEEATLQLAKEVAHDLLAAEPFVSLKDAQDKVAALVAKFPLFSTVKEYVDSYNNEKKLNVVIDRMQKYMKEQKIDEALAVAQKHNEKQT